MDFDEAFAAMRKLELTKEQVEVMRVYVAEAMRYHQTAPLGGTLCSLTDQELRVQQNMLRLKAVQYPGSYDWDIKRLQHEVDRRSLGRGTWPVGQKEM